MKERMRTRLLKLTHSAAKLPRNASRPLFSRPPAPPSEETRRRLRELIDGGLAGPELEQALARLPWVPELVETDEGMALLGISNDDLLSLAMRLPVEPD